VRKDLQSDRLVNAFQENILFHTHIEKTAGTSLLNVFVRAFGKEHVYDMRRSGRPAPDVLDAKERDKIFVLTGHFRYGRYSDAFHRNKLYIASVRPPLERIRSYYYFVRTRPDHPGYLGAHGKSFAQFIEHALVHRAPAPNLMARTLAGYPDPDPEQLRRHIEENYLLVTPHHRINESARALVRLLAGRTIKKNRHGNRSDNPSDEDIGELRKEFERANALDYLVYSFVTERYPLWLADLPARLKICGRQQIARR
jgi:hypothetical protein